MAEQKVEINSVIALLKSCQLKYPKLNIGYSDDYYMDNYNSYKQEANLYITLFSQKENDKLDELSKKIKNISEIVEIKKNELDLLMKEKNSMELYKSNILPTSHLYNQFLLNIPYGLSEIGKKLCDEMTCCNISNFKGLQEIFQSFGLYQITEHRFNYQFIILPALDQFLVLLPKDRQYSRDILIDMYNKTTGDIFYSVHENLIFIFYKL
jgi:hypothetical protein